MTTETVDLEITWIDMGRPPICVTVPTLDFMPPKHVASYEKWLEEKIQQEDAYQEWVEKTDSISDADEKPDPPCKKSDLVGERLIILRWLEPYLSKADMRAVNENVPIGRARQILDQIKPAEDITVGESAASADS